MQNPIRRVVTGHGPDGKSRILTDGPPPAGPAAHDQYVWTTGGVPAGDDGADAAAVPHRLEPVRGGSVFRIVEFPPDSVMAGLSAEAKETFFRDLFAGMDASHCRVDTTRSPGMHRTGTLDYVVVLRGELTVILDEGEATLKPGDVLVQRGTNHHWAVRGSEPAAIAVVMLDARLVEPA